MHFNPSPTVEEITDYIYDNNRGLPNNYLLCKHDTKTGIANLKGLEKILSYKCGWDFFDDLIDELELTTNSIKNPHDSSHYRTFIQYYTDNIITVRVSAHYSTTKSLKKAFKNQGKPYLQFHIILGRATGNINRNSVYQSGIFQQVTIAVYELDFDDVDYNNKRIDIIKQLIKILEGVKPSPSPTTKTKNNKTNTTINENKIYKNMNKKNTIKLTESELKQVITESVRNILKENMMMNMIFKRN